MHNVAGLRHAVAVAGSLGKGKEGGWYTQWELRIINNVQRTIRPESGGSGN